MTTLSDTDLMEAGLLTDAILGFRAGMKGPRPTDPALVEMPEHFYEDRNLPRRIEFRHGVKIAKYWRSMRTGAGVARREDRNRQFRDEGMAYCIDREAVQREAIAFLHSSIASADGFIRPDSGLVHHIVGLIDLQPRSWNEEEIMSFYHAREKNGILSTTFPCSLRAMGERSWKSAEAIYHAQKFPMNFEVSDAIRDAPDALAAKAKAREHRLERRRDWRSHKPRAMARVVVLRIEQDKAYRDFLIATKDATLVEDTTDGEHDDFWGVIDGKGVNMAGQIAMIARGMLVGGDRRFHPDVP